MSDRQSLDAVVRATDQASAVFRKVGTEADRMGKAVEDSGKRGARGLDLIRQHSVEVGAAIGATIGVVSRLGQASVAQENSIRSLGLAYGSATGDILDFSEALQDNSNFSNDAARSAALLGSTLTREYGLSAEQAQLLIQRSADLAQVYGFSLPDAMSRSASAIRGEAEAAEAMGVAMADSVLQAKAAEQGINNWTTGATEAEKAAVRFDEFMRQTAFVDGSAAKAADTTAGSVIHLKNELQDAATEAGAMLGPVGEAASVLGDLALVAPVAGAGLGKLAQSAAAARAATGALALATGPVGLVAAAVAAGAAIYYLTRGNDEEYTPATEAATDATESLTEAVYNLGRATQGVAIQVQAQAIADSWELIEQKITSAGDTLNQFYDEQGRGISPEEMQGLSVQEIVELGRSYGTMEDDLKAATLSVEQLAEAQADLNTVISHTGPGLGLALAAIQDEIDQYNRGEISAQQLAVAIDLISNNLNAYDEAAIKATQSTTGLTTATKEQTEALLAQAGATSNVLEIYGLLNQAGAEQGTQTSRQTQLWLDQQKALAAETFALHGASTAHKVLGDATEDTAGHQALLDHVLGSVTAQLDRQKAAAAADRAELDALGQSILDQADAMTQAVTGLVRDLGQMPTLLDAAGSHVGQIVSGLTADMERLGTAVSVVIDGTERLGSSSAQLDKWATELIGPAGVWSTIDDLLAKGAINQEQYNAAVEAGSRIAAQQVAINEDLLSIQAQQAPFLAEQQRAQAVRIDQLAHESAETQRIALGWMDVAEAQKAQQAVALAAAADGEQARKVATETIQQLVDQDPILRDMLESIGLITTDRQGRITVSFDGADTLKKTLDDLNATLSTLNDLLMGLPPGTTLRLNVEGIAQLNAGILALRELRALVSEPISPDFDLSDKFLSSGRFTPQGQSSLPPPPAPTGPRGVAGGFVAAEPLSGPPEGPQREWMPLPPVQTVVHPAPPTVITVDLDTTQAVAERDQFIAETNAMVGTVTIEGDNLRALGAVDDAVATANAARGTVAVDGNVNPFYSDIAGIDGRVVATAYVNVVAQGVGDFTGGLFGQGGVVGAGNGRVVEMAEYGPEWVRTPGGGGFLAAGHGLYVTPAGSLVTPHPATHAMGLDRMGGITVPIIIEGNVYGDDDFLERVSGRLVSVITQAADQYYRSQGWHG